jgi:pimeloyl-[acyl-carrier protein] methyl ester esterase
MYITSNGAGEDIVLLHGWGMNGEIWQDVADKLAQNYCVHVVDLPGYGASELVTPYTLQELVNALMDNFPLPVHIIGWSLGGLIGMQWALSMPENVKSLSLVAASPCFMQRPDWAFGTPPAHLAQFAHNLMIDYPGLIRKFLALQVLGSEVPLVQLRAVEQSLFKRATPKAEALMEGLSILEQEDLRRQIGGITCPVLLHYGVKDKMTPIEAGQWLAKSLPEARLEVYEKAAHIPFLSDLLPFCEKQRDFLRSV